MADQVLNNSLDVAANAFTLDFVSVHTGDPGADGSANMIGSKIAAVFQAATGGNGQRVLDTGGIDAPIGAGQTAAMLVIWSGTTARFVRDIDDEAYTNAGTLHIRGQGETNPLAVTVSLG